MSLEQQTASTALKPKLEKHQYSNIVLQMTGFCKCIVLKSQDEINQVISNLKLGLHQTLTVESKDASTEHAHAQTKKLVRFLK